MGCLRAYTFIESVNHDFMSLVYKVVMDNHKYTRFIHKGNWEKVSELTIMHIIKNFDPMKTTTDNLEDALDRYSKRIIKWIKENSSDELDLSEDFSLTHEPYLTNEEDEAEVVIEKVADENTVHCLEQLAFPCFIDMGYLETGKGKSVMQRDFESLKSLYSYKTLANCTRYIKSEYSKSILEFKERINNGKIGRPVSNFEKYIDYNIEYLGKNNGMLTITRKERTHTKHLYKVEYKSVFPILFKALYEDDYRAVMEIEGVKIYASLSGVYLNNIKELLYCIENELASEVLTKTGLSLFTYVRGEYAYFSSTKDNIEDLIIEVFGIKLTIPFTKVEIVEYLV